MTEPESNHPELTPAEEDAVRRHLAAARHTEPMPEAVAERLDRVLVGLADERRPAPAVAPVTDLATRRRRRGVQLLVAAAAVVVAGVGISQLPSPGSDDSAGGDSRSSFQGDSAMEGEQGSAPEEPGPDQWAEERDLGLSRLPVIRPGHFRADVAQPRLLTGDVASDAYRSQSKALEAGCPVPAKGERTLLVSYAGALAKLVYRVPTEDGQRVDLYRCGGVEGTSSHVRSVVLPSP